MSKRDGKGMQISHDTLHDIKALAQRWIQDFSSKVVHHNGMA